MTHKKDEGIQKGQKMKGKRRNNVEDRGAKQNVHTCLAQEHAMQYHLRTPMPPPCGTYCITRLCACI